MLYQFLIKYCVSLFFSLFSLGGATCFFTDMYTTDIIDDNVFKALAKCLIMLNRPIEAVAMAQYFDDFDSPGKN